MISYVAEWRTWCCYEKFVPAPETVGINWGWENSETSPIFLLCFDTVPGDEVISGIAFLLFWYLDVISCFLFSTFFERRID